MKKVVIVDYQLGNLFSVEQAFKHLGIDALISNDKNTIINADAIVLPGVGAFRDAMENIEKHDLKSPLIDFVASGKPFMGVCLGLQMLFTESEEFGASKGLGIIDGVVKKFNTVLPDNNKSKVPQIAWNRIYEQEIPWNETPLDTIESGTFQYFVHSYYTLPHDEKIILSKTNYEGFDYCSSVYKNNIFACQFHPEKSGELGLKIYQNWIKSI